jgi:rubrerythrin
MIESDSKDTIGAILERAIEIEYKFADIYREFSQQFSHIQEVSAFWQGVTEDEMQHAKALEHVRTSLTGEQLLSPCDEEVSEKVAGIQRMLSKILTKPIKNLDDAYELAHELEFSEVNAVFKLLATEFVPSEERKRFVVSELTQHQRKFVEFSRNFGDRDWRKGIGVHAA